MPSKSSALVALLVQRFEPLEAQAILKDLGHTGMIYAVAWSGGKQAVMYGLVDALERFGGADVAFFQALVDARPPFVDDIRAVAALWIGPERAAALAPLLAREPKGEPASFERRETSRDAHRPEGPVLTRGQVVDDPVRPARPPSEPITIRDTRERYELGSRPPQFQVFYKGLARLERPVELPSPATWMFGEPPRPLGPALASWLERAAYDASPALQFGAAVMVALRDWAEAVYAALFNNATAGLDYRDQLRAQRLDIRICSEDPRVMAWPWEALRDANAYPWAYDQRVSVVRFLERLGPGSPVLPSARDRVHILLVTARPFEQDVDFQAVSAGLVDLLYEGQDPPAADVTLLRPPTLQALQNALAKRPGYYHVLHFDGHGDIMGDLGVLHFEREGGGSEAVTADRLATAIIGHNLPIVVLNACRSATQSIAMVSPFASVASGLLKAGIGAVVAMSYTLNVDGARRFVPGFYQELFNSGDAATAAQFGRRRMHQEPHRRALCGSLVLEDWMIPVVYANQAVPIPFAATPRPKEPLPRIQGTEMRSDLHALVGRGAELRWLDRRVSESLPGIALSGAEGTGKSSLVRQFLIWLHRTEGLRADPLWFGCHAGGTQTGLVHRLAGELGLPPDASPAALEKMGAELRNSARWVVFDGFDALVGGPPPEAPLFNQLLLQIRGSGSRLVFIGRDRSMGLNPDLCAQRRLDVLNAAEATRLIANVLYEHDVRLPPESFVFQSLLAQTKGLPKLIVGLVPLVNSVGDAERLADLLGRSTALATGPLDPVIASIRDMF